MSIHAHPQQRSSAVLGEPLDRLETEPEPTNGPGPDQPGSDDPPPDPKQRPAKLASRTDRLVWLLFLLQVVSLPVVVLYAPQQNRFWVSALTLPAAIAVIVRIRGYSLGDWIRHVVGWAGRQRAIRSARRQGDGINPLSLLNDQLKVGSIQGPWNSDVGVLYDDSGWSSVLWATDGPDRHPHDEAADGLSRILSLPVPAYPAIGLRAVLQQSAPETDDPSASMLVTAWLVVRVEPLRALPPATAVGAVPALLRSEVRRLMNSTSDGGLALVTLDRDDLVSALAASTQIPLAQDDTELPDFDESWRRWRAFGREHGSFAVRPPSPDRLPEMVELLLDAASLCAGTTVTVSVRFGEESGRLARFPLLVRISHRDDAVVAEITGRLRRALRERGARHRSLDGGQGLALLATSVLAGRGWL